MKKLLEARFKAQNFIEPEMVEATFQFWFTDSEHLRSPFPQYIRDGLQLEATNSFLNWSSRISDKAKKEINDEILAEKFEEIIFEKALQMVQTEDEQLSIRYPFMPRLNDVIHLKDKTGVASENTVTERSYYKTGDDAFLKVKLKNTQTSKEWETEFELPE